MALCDCSGGAKNMGTPGCLPLLARPQKFAFTNRVANDGTLNKIELGDTLDQAYFDALINNTNPSKKLFVSQTVNKVADARAEFNTFDIDGFAITTSEGVRTVAFTVIDGASPRMAEAFNSRACLDDAFYTFSVNDQIGGNGSVAGELRPFRIKRNTMRAVYNPESKDPEAPAMVMVQFALSEREHDKDIAFIPYGTGDNDVQIIVNDLTGLIDVTMEPAASITTTTFIVDMYLTGIGNHLEPVPFTGGVLADFTLKELTPTPATITITSVTESLTVPGRYAFVQPTATSADTQRLSFAKAGYEATDTIDLVIP